MLAAADDGTSYGFRHALLQEAVYDDLLPGERRRYHLGFVGALQAGIDRQAADRPPSAARLAQVVHHALAADDLVTALRASVAAGTAAMSAGAFVDASKHLERAVQLSEAVPDPAAIVDGGRPELLRLAAEAASFSTDPARALRLWQEALDAAGPDAPPEDRARLLLGLAVCANDVFDNDLAVRSTRAANELLADQPPSFLRAQARADLARDLYVVGEIPAGNATAQEAIALAAEVGDLRTEALALGRLALSRIQVGEVEQAKADAGAGDGDRPDHAGPVRGPERLLQLRLHVRHPGRSGDRRRDPGQRGHSPRRPSSGSRRWRSRPTPGGTCGRRAAGTRASACSTTRRGTSGREAAGAWPSGCRRPSTMPSACPTCRGRAGAQRSAGLRRRG